MKISKISEKISHGQYDLRIPDLNASSEIEHLRLALNSMLTTIEKALATETKAKDQMARFIADASHELRTPLTSIRGFLEILLKNETQDIQTLQSAHNTMLIETERLIQLTENLLALQAIADEASEEKQEHPQTSAQETLPNILPLLQSLAGKRSLAINSENLELPLKPSEFKQILYNLIHNAVQHTSDDGKISVSIFKNQNDILLQISDNGEGIPSKDLPHIFDRFYRGTRSRQKQKGKGAGLGLAIVHEIVGLRGGKIEVISEIGKGSTISIIFMQTT
jgi:two-component system OmpR family sensor kinase